MSEEKIYNMLKGRRTSLAVATLTENLEESGKINISGIQ